MLLLHHDVIVSNLGNCMELSRYDISRKFALKDVSLNMLERRRWCGCPTVHLYLIYIEAKHIKESVFIGKSISKNDSNTNYDIMHTSLLRYILVKEYNNH